MEDVALRGTFRRPLGSFRPLPEGRFTRVETTPVLKAHFAAIARYRDLEGPPGSEFVAKQVELAHLRCFEGAERDDRKLFFSLSPLPVEDAGTDIGVHLLLEELRQQGYTCPHLLRLHGVYVDGFGPSGCAWLMTTACEGGDLVGFLLSEKRLAEQRAKTFYVQMLEALRFLHEHNIAHRDISLDNLLLHRGAVKVMDFGAAEAIRNSATSQPVRYFQMVGRDAYRPPEAWMVLHDPEVQIFDRVEEEGALAQVKVERGYFLEVLAYRQIGELVGYLAAPVDVFSAAVVLHCLLLNKFPWKKASDDDMYFKAFWKSRQVYLETPLAVSPEAVEVLNGALCARRADRWSVEECLNCKWLRDATLGDGHDTTRIR